MNHQGEERVYLSSRCEVSRASDIKVVDINLAGDLCCLIELPPLIRLLEMHG